MTVQNSIVYDDERCGDCGTAGEYLGDYPASAHRARAPDPGWVSGYECPNCGRRWAL